MSKLTPEQEAKVAKVIEEFRKGKLKSRGDKTVKDEGQARAIALSEAASLVKERRNKRAKAFKKS